MATGKLYLLIVIVSEFPFLAFSSLSFCYLILFDMCNVFNIGTIKETYNHITNTLLLKIIILPNSNSAIFLLSTFGKSGEAIFASVKNVIIREEAVTYAFIISYFVIKIMSLFLFLFYQLSRSLNNCSLNNVIYICF